MMKRIEWMGYAVLAAVMVTVCGCSTPVKPFAGPTPDARGGMVGVNIGADATPTWLDQNYGKVAGGLATAVGGYLVYANSHKGSSSSSAAAPAPAGNGNIVVVGNQNNIRAYNSTTTSSGQ